jgi:hypothetical protein
MTTCTCPSYGWQVGCPAHSTTEQITERRRHIEMTAYHDRLEAGHYTKPEKSETKKSSTKTETSSETSTTKTSKSK